MTFVTSVRVSPGFKASTLIMAQDERPGDGGVDDNWRHSSSLHNMDLNSLGSMDEIRSFTESPPISPSLLIDTTTAVIGNDESHIYEENDGHLRHHKDTFDDHQDFLLLSPTRFDSPSALDSSVGVGDHHRRRPLVNAVHMEIQENAKLPTFNLAVDRSNSTGDVNRANYFTDLSPQTRKEIDNLIRLEEYDKTLSEYFLKSEHRHSQTSTYESACALFDELLADPMPHPESPNITKNSVTELEVKPSMESQLEDLTETAVEPTPLDQIKARGYQWKDQQMQNYLYQRHTPLPIPTGVAPNPPLQPLVLHSPEVSAQSCVDLASSSPLLSSPLSLAVATAAAIAAHTSGSDAIISPSSGRPANNLSNVNDVKHDKHNSVIPNACNRNGLNNVHPEVAIHSKIPIPAVKEQGRPLLSKKGAKSAVASSSETVEQSSSSSNSSSLSLPYLPSLQSRLNTRVVHRHLYHPVASSSIPAAAQKGNTTTQAIVDASKVKSQFGFGDDHVVPSVPDPPPKPNSSLLAAVAHPALKISSVSKLASYSKDTATPKGSDSASKDKPASPSSSSAGPVNNFINGGEAYERKKQRAKDSRVRLNESIERLSIAISLVASQSKQRAAQVLDLPVSFSHRNSLIRIMEDAGAAAEMAKKWDRPTFVGLAASLIQTLNAECEALLEIVSSYQTSKKGPALDQHEQQTQQSSESIPSSESDAAADDSPIDGKRVQSDALSTQDISMNQSPPKRQRIDDIEQRACSICNSARNYLSSMFTEMSIMRCLVSFLDPITLSRCPIVSSVWKFVPIFSDDSVWMALAVQRFGPFQVRHWLNKLKPDDNVILSARDLYRRMDEVNVMPRLSQDEEESLIRLGEGRIGTKVSAWAFAVQRSNGETIRSVRRKETIGDKEDSLHATLIARSHDYVPLPVVEMRIVVQNIGMAEFPIKIKHQFLSVDASTRRRHEEFREIAWDDRLELTVRTLDHEEPSNGNGVHPNNCGKPSQGNNVRGEINHIGLTVSAIDKSQQPLERLAGHELCRLRLYDTRIITVFLQAQGCTTLRKFQEKSNLTKLLVCLNGTTVPLVIPFLRDDSNR